MKLRLFPWFDQDKEKMRDKRTDDAVKRGKEVETTVRELAESYRAVGLILRKADRTRHYPARVP